MFQKGLYYSDLNYQLNSKILCFLILFLKIILNQVAALKFDIGGGKNWTPHVSKGAIFFRESAYLKFFKTSKSIIKIMAYPVRQLVISLQINRTGICLCNLQNKTNIYYILPFKIYFVISHNGSTTNSEYL